MKTTRRSIGKGWGRHLARTSYAAAGLVLFMAGLPLQRAYADYAAGLKAYTAADYKTAFNEWAPAAEAGDPQAQHGLGVLYESGLVTGKADMPDAIRWYQAAVKQGFADSQNNLAMIYLYGRGVPKDPKKAISLWTKAADSGNNLALFNLGLQYLNGIGVAKSEKKAADLIAKAADGNLSQAQFLMGIFYREGQGVKKDEAQSTQWLKRAAESGNPEAKVELAKQDPAVAEQVAAAKETANAPGNNAAGNNAGDNAATKPADKTAGAATEATTDQPASNAAAKAPDMTASETKATDTKPVEGKAADAHAAETQSSEAKPADTKQAETKPAEDKTGETKTASAGAPVEQHPASDQKATAEAKPTAEKSDEAKPADVKTGENTAAEKPAAATATPDDQKADQAHADQAKADQAKPADHKAADQLAEKADNTAGSVETHADKGAADKAEDHKDASKDSNGDLAGTGLKKSVTGTPAFATADAGQSEKAAKTGDGNAAEKPAGEADADQSHAEKPAGDKPAAEKPAESNVVAAQSGSAKKTIPDNVPVAESLDGPDNVYRIWLSSKSSGNDARSDWDRLLQKYPSILKKLEPDIRQYRLNEVDGSIYRLFAGPFKSLDDAQKVCDDIHERYQAETCRTVIN